jgi:hypothetical protein
MITAIVATTIGIGGITIATTIDDDGAACRHLSACDGQSENSAPFGELFFY